MIDKSLDLSAAALRPLSRSRGRVGVGVPAQQRPAEFGERFPSPAALFERVDLPRKRER